MIVRIRFGKGAIIEKGRRKNQRVASVAAALLSPAAVIAAAFAVWRITADMNLTRNFAIPTGLFSYWHVWVVIAVALQLCARWLNHYARSTHEVPAPDVAAS